MIHEELIMTIQTAAGQQKKIVLDAHHRSKECKLKTFSLPLPIEGWQGLFVEMEPNYSKSAGIAFESGIYFPQV